MLFFQGEAPGDEFRLGDDAAGARVHAHVCDDQAVGGQVAAVPKDDAADVTDALAIHEYPAGVHFVADGGGAGLEAHLIAVGGQQDPFLRYAHGPGQVAVLDKVAQFTVDGNEIAGTGEGHQELQFLLGGVPRDVDVNHFLVGHFGA